mmetsp:Transcript_42946/g.139353  ORF Transcript_42946/g.139353 Transcript_42946/m.139353 type:complete len:148 (-) Transcript_42946:159-602(-)
MRAKGGELLRHVGSASDVAAAGLSAELAAPAPTSAADVGLTERWVDELAAHLEEQIFFAGAGEVARTKLIAAALMKRRAVQRVLDKTDARTARLQRAMAAITVTIVGVSSTLSSSLMPVISTGCRACTSSRNPHAGLERESSLLPWP